MGYSAEDLSSSQSDSFQLHSVVQCCCAGRCCSDNLVTQEIPCHLCDGAEDHGNRDNNKEKVIENGLKMCQRY